MTEKDLIITPLWFIILVIGAYLIRPYVTDQNTRRYFMPALTVRFVAAILLGVLYQFYYGGGDTFNYHTHGSVHIYEAFQDSFIKGIKLLFASGEYVSGTYEYASKIRFYNDRSTYSIVKITAFFDLFTVKTYSASALFFGLFSFSGLWALYQVFYQQYKNLHLYLALAILFFPSVVFWGSGILKDTITIGALGWSIYLFIAVFNDKSYRLLKAFLLLINLYLIFQIKIYVALTLIPALMMWWLLNNLEKIRSLMLKLIIGPVMLVVGGFIIFLLVENLASTNSKYNLNNIAKTAQITAYDIGFYTGRDAGSGYSLGKLDGTIPGLISLFPEAVNVTLFRPYLWEINNPLMAFSAIESLILLISTFYVLIYIIKYSGFKILLRSNIVFLLSFSLVFAFSVGVSTFNFGTLARYKIPLLPLYSTALILVYNSIKQKVAKSHLKLTLQNNVW